MSSKHSFLLTMRGTPTCFDYCAEDELMIVASKGMFSFFKLQSLGTPKQIIYNEQMKETQQLMFQKSNRASIFGALSHGIVSTWDSTKSVKPILQYQSISCCVTSMAWSEQNCDILAMMTENGTVCLWDTRSPQSSMNKQLVTAKCCSHLQWSSHNHNILSTACDEKYILFWDVRHMPVNNQSSTSIRGDLSYSIIKPENGVINFALSKSNSCAYICSSLGMLEEWDFAVTNRDATLDASASDHMFRSLSAPHVHHSSILSIRPVSNQLVVATFDDSDNSSQSLHYSGNIAQSSIFVHESCSSADENQNNIFHASQNNGSTREGSNSTASLPLTTTSATTFPSIRSRSIDNSSNSAQIASCSSRVLGIAWGAANSQFFNISMGESSNKNKAFAEQDRSLEYPLLILTSSALFHVIDISNSKTQRASVVTKELEKASAIVEYPLGRSSAYLKDKIGTYSAADSPFGGSNYREASNSGNNSSVVTSGVVGPRTFLKQLTTDLQAVEHGIFIGKQLEGLRIFRVDQFSRRITLELLIPNAAAAVSLSASHHNNTFAGYYKSDDLYHFYKSGACIKSIDLHITFPIKLQQLWNPTFSIESRYGFEVMVLLVIYLYRVFCG
jgi:hypothetical protein